jgi:hypothetical protein
MPDNGQGKLLVLSRPAFLRLAIPVAGLLIFFALALDAAIAKTPTADEGMHLLRGGVLWAATEDEFSNPASGWDVVDNAFEHTEYLNGEYRVLSKQSGFFYLYMAPACGRENYVVEVDARWVGTPGQAYGIIFGLLPDYSRYYLFDVNTDFQQYRLLRRDPDGFRVIQTITDAPAVNAGNASNHLKVTRNGAQITLEVNGTTLGTWNDGNITGSTFAGVVTNPYGGIPVSDARFDNYSSKALPSSTTAGVDTIRPNAASSSSNVSMTTHLAVPATDYSWAFRNSK